VKLLFNVIIICRQDNNINIVRKWVPINAHNNIAVLTHIIMHMPHACKT